MGRHKDAGFTMLEMLFSLSVMIVILFFFSLLVGSLHVENRTAELEMETMFQQVAKDIRKAVAVEVRSNRLYLLSPSGDEVMFEHYHNMLRKRVNGRGHEVVATHIANVHFSQKRNGVVVELQRENGELYSRRLSQIPYTGRLT